MQAGRIESAIERIEAAMERIAAAREAVETQAARQPEAAAPSAKVVELVNSHERLREQVAESLCQLDQLIKQLED